MRKFLMIPAGSLVLALGGIGTASASDETVAGCLAKYGTQVLPSQVASVDRQCRVLLFPPPPQFTNGLFQLGGDEVRAQALACSETYGAVTDLAAIGDASCLVFYYPADLETATRVRIKVPAPEAGGVHKL